LRIKRDLFLRDLLTFSVRSQISVNFT
jgi:hypothetical protein